MGNVKRGMGVRGSIITTRNEQTNFPPCIENRHYIEKNTYLDYRTLEIWHWNSLDWTTRESFSMSSTFEFTIWEIVEHVQIYQYDKFAAPNPNTNP